MQAAIPSRTALRVALRRAAHQIYDLPLVFHDPLAVRLLGEAYLPELHKTVTKLEKPFSVAMRAHLVARSQYAEEQLAVAVRAEPPATQYVLLGAGLDTFGHRNPYPGLRVFEVDHPATQAWKLELLAHAALAPPDNLTHVPVDFETQSLAEQLLASGFDTERVTVFAMLGVVPYLTLEAFRATVQFVAGHRAGSGLIFDYGQPRRVLPVLEQLAHDSLAARVQLAGEPFQLFFTPAEAAAELGLKFRRIEDLGAEEINARYFSGRADQLKLRGTAGRLLSAWL